MTPYQYALAELGTHETPGTDSTQRILEYHAATTLHAKSDEVPWCSAFVNWCCLQAGIHGTRDALAMSWLSWGNRITTPVVGCITVIASDTGYHVAFYHSAPLVLLGGNQHDRVDITSFKASRLIAHIALD